MEEAKPLRIGPPSASGGGPQRSDDTVRGVVTEVKEGEGGAESPSMKLLGKVIGAAEQRPVIIKHSKPPLLRAIQLDELQRQVVIYEHIARGLPVPSALVLPIWNRVAASLGCDYAVIYRLYPSFVGFSPQDFDYRNLMDPEPGRCRRTDGKKWRCKKNVVPGQKYCERHMHRGRQRSRKLVEASEVVTASNSASKNALNLNANSSSSTPATLSYNIVKGHKRSGIANSIVDAQIIAGCAVSGPKSASTSMTPRGIGGCINATAFMIAGTVHTESTITTATIGTNKAGGNNNHGTNGIDDWNGNCSNYVKNLMNCNSSGSIKNAKGATFQGLNFSPKSVLQVEGCRAACFCRSDLELESGRCRRTDGKKWQCRRDVVPREKYCRMHMHRAAKKRKEAFELPTLLSATLDISTSAHPHPTEILPSKRDGTNLNTNLSISISANPQLVTNNNISDTTTSVSSDTTISDTIIASCEDGEFSS